MGKLQNENYLMNEETKKNEVSHFSAPPHLNKYNN